MKRFVSMCISAIVVLIAANAALAGGPEIKPGKWEFKTTMHNSMMPEPKVITETQCVTEEDASGDPLAAMLEDSDCKVLSREESDNSIDFEVECRGDMDMTMTGKGTFTGDGTTAHGKIDMTMTIPQMGGKTMKMTQEWDAKRIGDCD